MTFRVTPGLLLGLTVFIIGVSEVFGQPPPPPVPARCLSSPEHQMLQYWGRYHRLPTDLLDAFLIAEGITDSLRRRELHQQVDHLLEALERRIKPGHSPAKKGRRIFDFLHRRCFKKYVLNARLSHTLTAHAYNCLTATALFYLFGEHFQVPIRIYTSPTHVFAAVDEADRRITVELTDPRGGFDYRGNWEEHVEFLLRYKLISREELERKGPEQIYDEYVQHRREIRPEQLVAVVYNNLAVEYLEQLRYEEALCAIKKALHFDAGDPDYHHKYQAILQLLVQSVEMDLGQQVEAVIEGLRFFPRDGNFQRFGWSVVERAIYQLVSREKDFARASRIVAGLYPLMEESPEMTRRVQRLREIVDLEWIGTLFRRGEYQTAYQKILPLYRRAPDQPRFKDVYVDVTIKYADYLSSYGKIEQGLELLDTLRVQCGDYPVVKEAYAEIVLRYLGRDLEYRTHPERARKLLVRAFAVDPDNVYIRRGLATVYHELTMEAIRAKRYREAKKIVLEGLQYNPEDQVLQDDLGHINDLLVYIKQRP